MTPHRRWTPTPARPVALAFASSLTLMIAACDGGSTSPATEPPVTVVETPAPAAPTEPRPEVKPPEAVPSEASLPLRRGVYVMTGTDCAAPSNAGFRVFNGQGLSGSTTRACEAMISDREGAVLMVRQICEDTYSGQRTPADFRLEPRGDDRFVLTERGEGAVAYRLCPADAVPEYLQQIADEQR